MATNNLLSKQSINQKQHTLGHLACPACDELRASLLGSISADLQFKEAAHRWLDSRSVNAMPGAITARYIRETTEESYEQYIRSLELFFNELTVKEIHLGHIAAYQRARIQGASPFIRKRRPQDAEPRPSPVKPKKVNQEIGLLKQIMKRAGCWPEQYEELYEPLLDDEDEIPRSLTPDEQRLWLDCCRLQSRWNVVYWYSILAFGTCMSTDEIRGIRLGDINLFQRVITIPRKTAKNKYRARTIEIVNADVLWALERLVERARDLGCRGPLDYLFPRRISAGKWDESHTRRLGIYDPAKAMSDSGIKKLWEEVRDKSKLKWFRQYDCRHTAITRLAESGVPVDVIMSRAGHVSEKMRRHYTHISQAAQRRWMEHANSFHGYGNEDRSASLSRGKIAAYRN